MMWNTLTGLQQFLRETPGVEYVSIVGIESEQPEFTANDIRKDAAIVIDLTAKVDFRKQDVGASAHILATDPFTIQIQSGAKLHPADRMELKAYLPYSLLPWFSTRHERCFAISHFAQTLDGRIAAASGDSKWIGNDENLVHAHKMRALCDAIMIGANTLHQDNPRLTVRHVSGKQPIRIVIGQDQQTVAMAAIDAGPILQVGSTPGANGTDRIVLEKINGSFDCKEILHSLYRRQITSVYIEGGAITTSCFMQQLALDQVQIHISPLVLGSGTTGFEFNGANTMNEAFCFANPRFVSMGDQVMFVGEVVG